MIRMPPQSGRGGAAPPAGGGGGGRVGIVAAVEAEGSGRLALRHQASAAPGPRIAETIRAGFSVRESDMPGSRVDGYRVLEGKVSERARAWQGAPPAGPGAGW